MFFLYIILQQNKQMNREVEVTVSNLPNTTKREDIIQYLETAGPIKDFHFFEDGQRLSAKIIYYNVESAQIAKKFLSQKEFNARNIRISFDSNKYPVPQQANQLFLRLSHLSQQDRRLLYSYLKVIRDEQGEMFTKFLQQNPDLVKALLS